MRLFILCEGLTEDRFVKEILCPYLQSLNIFAIPIIFKQSGQLIKNIKKADDNAVIALERIRSGFPSPEHINDSEDTAPSKRIKRILPEYSKTLNGIEIAKRIGVDRIAEECRHFKAWLDGIKALAMER